MLNEFNVEFGWLNDLNDGFGKLDELNVGLISWMS